MPIFIQTNSRAMREFIEQRRTEGLLLHVEGPGEGEDKEFIVAKNEELIKEGHTYIVKLPFLKDNTDNFVGNKSQ